jgi:hypothetical protein
VGECGAPDAPQRGLWVEQVLSCSVVRVSPVSLGEQLRTSSERTGRPGPHLSPSALQSRSGPGRLSRQWNFTSQSCPGVGIPRQGHHHCPYFCPSICPFKGHSSLKISILNLHFMSSAVMEVEVRASWPLGLIFYFHINSTAIIFTPPPSPPLSPSSSCWSLLAQMSPLPFFLGLHLEPLRQPFFMMVFLR